MSVRWAFIGAGRHIRLWLAPALQAAQGKPAVGVWSRHAEQRESFAAEYGVSRVYGQLDDLLADPDIDAVCIATPNNMHATHALAALRAGKHVLCEKPMATKVDDAVEMVNIAEQAGRQLGVGFHLRHNLIAQAAEQRVRDGAIGNVSYASAQFNLTSSPAPRLSIPHAAWKRDPDQMGGAGALMGLGVHVIDLLRFVLGTEVCAVQAHADGFGPDARLESFAQVMLEFQNGAQAHIAYGGSFPLSRNDLVVYGQLGRLTAENVIDVTTAGRLELTVSDDPPGRRTEAWTPGASDHYQRQFQAFNRAITEEAPFSPGGLDGLRVVEVASAIIDAQQTGQRVLVHGGRL